VEIRLYFLPTVLANRGVFLLLLAPWHPGTLAPWHPKLVFANRGVFLLLLAPSQDKCVVYVQHEILANDETTVLQYMMDAQVNPKILHPEP
jgi:hypothetical protein